MFSKRDLIKIIERVELKDENVTNAYIFGSTVHGTNTENSDIDIIIVADIDKRLKFNKTNYFHKYRLHSFELVTKNNKNQKFDIVVYSKDNFEKLLECCFLVCVECIFSPEKFILRNNVDYKKIYLDKYYNKSKLREALFQEYCYSQNFMEKYLENTKLLDENKELKIQHFDREKNKYLTVKKLYNFIRYGASVEQLLEVKEITHFGIHNRLFLELKEMYEKNMTIKEINKHMYKWGDYYYTNILNK